jgi:adenosine deaminase
MKKNLLLPILLGLFINIPVYAESSEEITRKIFEQIVEADDRTKLQSFLEEFPKGADIHNHPVGGGMAESMISYAKGEQLCVDLTDEYKYRYRAKNKSDCSPGEPQLDTFSSDYPVLYNSLIDAWSMRNFKPGGTEKGRDRFFKAFGKFSAIYKNHNLQVLAEVVNRAGEQGEVYVELTEDRLDEGLTASELGKKVGWNSNFDQMADALFHNGVKDVAQQILKGAEQRQSYLFKNLQCDSANPMPGCDVKVRYLFPVLRLNVPEVVFTQIYAGFLAANAGAGIVGINMAQPEDNPIAIKDYKLHMKMVGYFHKKYPHVQITLHAGELAPGLVPNNDLRFHIRQAVEVANAKRIGHGVAITHEDNYQQLLQTMADKHILVEINLSSNEAVLDAKGANHPLPLYLKNKVPVTLSTDDEGILRTNLTSEYVKAVTTYKRELDYATIKMLARNSIAYSFLPGASLWTDYDYKKVNSACAKDTFGNPTPSAQCALLLKSSDKAESQWKLEGQFNAFEKNVSENWNKRFNSKTMNRKKLR